jgi:ribonuclease PH
MELKNKFRNDFREAGHVRPFSAEMRLISDATGSARFALGHTAAVACIYGPGTKGTTLHRTSS